MMLGPLYACNEGLFTYAFEARPIHTRTWNRARLHMHGKYDHMKIVPEICRQVQPEAMGHNAHLNVQLRLYSAKIL